MAENVERVFNNIADAGGSPESVQLIAVTKGFGPEMVAAAHAAGLVDLGESYVQEFEAKRIDASVQAIEPGLRWHFIGRLQTNKVRSLADVDVELIHSVDRTSLVKELAKRKPGQRVLIQVNIGEEEQKGGCSFDDVDGLVARARDSGLAVAGLMGVARLADDDDTRRQFDHLVAVADRHELVIRSIGMSGDLGIAVRAGSNMIRVGTAIFGPRPPR
ncbi:MAG: YggS family pyridoxal phosphate-dependent enzyme [Actinomycetia bacterium]|nr:YggS family pyridoxal phosphate-dependent enzyme [Actinomycetes bacterium]